MNGQVEIEALSLAYRHDEGWLDAVAEVSFTLAPGEIFGIVGESGCGKSSLALQLLGYHHPRGRVRGGRVVFDGEDVLAFDREALNRLRGARIGFVPQNPTTALNPARRVGRLIAEVLAHHGAAAPGETAAARVAELLRQVGLPTPEAMARRYAHQLSGGQQQRVMIAMALACRPEVVVLEEPTTGLDVTTQKQIVTLLAELRDRLGTSMVYVTHDMGVIRDIADRVGVMYAGRMVEVAPTEALFAAPAHPYTQGLIASIPKLDAETPPRTVLKGLLRREALPEGCPFTPRCDFAEPSCATTRQSFREAAPGHAVACQRWSELVPPTREATPRSETVEAPVSGVGPVLAFDGVSLRYGRSAEAVVRGVSFDIAEGETFGLVGESGSGKSTLARAVSGLLAPAAGAIRFEGAALPGLVRARTADHLRRIQYIFQNPDASLNPRLRVREILGRPPKRFFGLERSARRQRVARALEEVRLPESYAARFPDQLSGGERQRIAIARALVAEPALMLCDEVLSGLDVSVQSSVLELLRGLAAKTAVAMLFISHDLAVVRHLAQRVGVLFDGEMMETGETEEMFAPPFHPYTRSLLAALPGTGVGGAESATAATASRRGCAFAGRCPVQRGRLCEEEPPPWRRAGRTHGIRCHIPVDELAAA